MLWPDRRVCDDLQMPCEHVRTLSGHTMIVCTRRRRGKPRRCKFCSSAAALLCDYVLARGRICSAPLCVRCAVRVDGGTRGTLDHCRDHTQQMELAL